MTNDFGKYKLYPQVLKTLVQSAKTVRKISEDTDLANVGEMRAIFKKFLRLEGIRVDPYLLEYEFSYHLKQLGVKLKGEDEKTNVIRDSVQNPFEADPKLKKERSITFNGHTLYVPATTLKKYESGLGLALTVLGLEYRDQLLYVATLLNREAKLTLEETLIAINKNCERFKIGISDHNECILEVFEIETDKPIKNTRQYRRSVYQLQKRAKVLPDYDYDGDIYNESEVTQCIENDDFYYDVEIEHFDYFKDREAAKIFLSVKANVPLEDVKESWIDWAVSPYKTYRYTGDSLTIGVKERKVWSRGEVLITSETYLDQNFKIKRRQSHFQESYEYD